MSFPFTVEDFEGAYHRTGFRPVAGLWVTDEGGTPAQPYCGCPLATMIADRFGAEAALALDDTNNEFSYITEKLGLAAGQIEGFVHGYEGYGITNSADVDAYRTGEALRDRMRPEIRFIPDPRPHQENDK